MLIDFSVKNFLSIKNEQTLSMETGERLYKFKKENTIETNGEKLLKNVLIVGPNGSGKTNLINALKVLQKIIIDTPEKATDKLPSAAFLLDEDSSDKPTVMDIRFIKNDKKFHYQLSFTKDKIVYESLEISKNSTGKYIQYFLRENNVFKKIPTGLEILSEQTRTNEPIVSSAQKLNDPISIELLEWFNYDLRIGGTRDPEDYYKFLNNEKLKDQFIEFMQAVDMNIVDVEVRKNSIELPEKLKELMDQESFISNELYILYNKYDANGNLVGRKPIPIGMDSRGTNKIKDIALSFLNAQVHKNNKVLVFDEFDDSLHFEISSALIKLFNSVGNKNQVIVTTHELKLLDDKLRKDQIYFVEKDFQGETTLYSLFDFKNVDKTRSDFSYYTRYLQGKFGAVPNVRCQDMINALRFNTEQETEL